MQLTFDDNSTDEIVLTPASNIPGEDTPCLFSGKLPRDPQSKVAVSGCKYSNTTSLSIKSILVKEGLIDLSIMNGITYEFILESELTANGFQMDTMEASGRIKRQALRNSGKDFFIPPPNPKKIRRRFRGPLPAKVSLKTKVKYDRSLKNYFGNSDQRTKEWISAVVELTKPRMAHSSLNLPIDIVVEEVDFLNREIKADGASIGSLRPDSFTSYFCADLGGGIIGVAYLGTACRTDGFGVNINELYTERNSELATARVYAHELGHNIGME